MAASIVKSSIVKSTNVVVIFSDNVKKKKSAAPLPLLWWRTFSTYCSPFAGQGPKTSLRNVECIHKAQ